jgi:hypothetical protein
MKKHALKTAIFLIGLVKALAHLEAEEGTLYGNAEGTKKRNALFYMVSILIFIPGCHITKDQLEIETISVDIKSNAEMILSDYFEDFRMIKLAMDENYPVGEIAKIQQENHQIYISDGHTLFIFSETGDWVSGFNHTGNGSGEYHSITDFTIVEDDIIILDRDKHKLLTYNPLGMLISEITIPYWAMKLSPSIDRFYMIYGGNEPGNENAYKLHLTQNGQNISQFLPVNQVQTTYLHVSALSNFFKYKHQIRFFETFNDTIYTLNGNRIEPTFHIDYRGRNIPSSFFDNDYANIFDFFQAVHNASYAYGITQLVENDKIMMFGSYYRRESKITLADIQDKKSYTFASIKDDVFFGSLIIPMEDFVYFADENIIFSVDAPKIIEWRDKYQPGKKYENMIGATNENDNPVLMIFNLKSDL